jgi:hypothetical protein
VDHIRLLTPHRGREPLEVQFFGTRNTREHDVPPVAARDEGLEDAFGVEAEFRGGATGRKVVFVGSYVRTSRAIPIPSSLRIAFVVVIVSAPSVRRVFRRNHPEPLPALPEGRLQLRAPVGPGAPLFLGPAQPSEMSSKEWNSSPYSAMRASVPKPS